MPFPDPEPHQRAGCPMCLAGAPELAWESLRRVCVGVIVEESHYSVRVTACECGQHFGVVFAEQIDWAGGEDDQTWLAVPLSHAESARVLASGEPALLEAARGRRFLLRAFPTTGHITVAWRDDGFRIPAHD